VGIYPSVLCYFHVRREIEGAGGGELPHVSAVLLFSVWHEFLLEMYKI
jgi:hypothetical protein